jgi:rod shape-determining protein MreD
MNRRAKVVSVILHVLLIVVVYVFQSMIFPYIPVFGLYPLLLPITSTGIAVYGGCNAGGIAGLFAGMLCDVSLNQPTGVFMVLLTLTGLFIGALADTIMTRGFVTFFLSCVGILVLSAFIQIFPFLLFSTVPQAALLNIGIWQTVYSLIFAFPLWFFVRALSRRAQEASSRERPL